MPGHPVRKRIRLAGFDYAFPGAYFITVCTHQRAGLFGEIIDGAMRLNAFGTVAQASWMEIPRHFPLAESDALVLMPNHLHAIVDLHGRGTACRAPTTEGFGHPVPGSVATIIRSAKAASSRRINLLRGTPGAPVWQRGYFEHVIRSPLEFDRLRAYIETNPLRWELDRENPENT